VAFVARGHELAGDGRMVNAPVDEVRVWNATEVTLTAGTYSVHAPCTPVYLAVTKR